MTTKRLRFKLAFYAPMTRESRLSQALVASLKLKRSNRINVKNYEKRFTSILSISLFSLLLLLTTHCSYDFLKKMFFFLHNSDYVKLFDFLKLIYKENKITQHYFT